MPGDEADGVQVVLVEPAAKEPGVQQISLRSKRGNIWLSDSVLGGMGVSRMKKARVGFDSGSKWQRSAVTAYSRPSPDLGMRGVGDGFGVGFSVTSLE